VLPLVQKHGRRRSCDPPEIGADDAGHIGIVESQHGVHALHGRGRLADAFGAFEGDRGEAAEELAAGVAVELSTEESAAVRKALAEYLGELRMEISNTDNAEFRRGLQAERTALESALSKLDGAAREQGGETDEVVVITLAWAPLLQ
jgi:hypothetical protein